MTEDRNLFWTLAEELRRECSGVAEGTVMGRRCLRLEGEFLAMPHADTGLVIKLPEERVGALVDEGVGEPFAPAGRTFRHWVSVPRPDRRLWKSLLLEAADFVG